MTIPQPIRISLIALLVIIYVLAWRSARPEMSDFPAFYTSARLWKFGQNPYDRAAECAEQLKIRSDLCLPNPHPPILMPLFALVSNDDYVSSFNRWAIILIFVLGLSCWIAYRLTNNALAAANVVLFYPAFISITQGQVSAFILLSVMAWVYLLDQRKDFLAGIALSLSLVKPQLAIALAVPLLFSRRRAFIGFTLGALVLFIYSLALVGPSGLRSLIQTVSSMAQGAEESTHAQRMYSVTGILARSGISTAWSWLFFCAAIIVNSVLWRRTKASTLSLMIGLVFALFASPHLHVPELCLLAIPLVLIHPFAPALASALLLVALPLGFPHFAGYLLMLTLVSAFLLRNSKSGFEGVVEIS